MLGTPAPIPSPDEHVSLLDLIVIVAESWKLLLFAPLAVALIAFGIASLQPREYRSTASFAVTPDAAAAYLASGGITEIASVNGMPATQLEAGLSLVPIDRANPYHGTFAAAQFADAETATAVLEDLSTGLALAIEEGRIDLPYEHAQAEIVEIRESVTFYDGALTELAEQLEGLRESGATFERIALTNVMSQSMDVLAGLKSKEAGLVQMQSGLSAELVIAVPTPPRPGSISPTLTAVLAAITVGLLLLIWIFGREGLRRSSTLPGGAEKLGRIKRAFAFRRTKD